MLESIEAPIIDNITYTATPTTAQTKPVIAIPFPAAFLAKATPPNIMAIIPQGIQMYAKQKNTNDTIPKTIEAIESPFDWF